MKSHIGLVKRSMIKGGIIVIFAFISAVILGVILSNINNSEKIEDLLESRKPAMPSVLLDRNGEVITEFYSDEKRDIVSIDAIPDYLIRGLIIWEDDSFYHHHGFNPLAIARASFNNLIGRPVSGASTLTQQLSRTLFLNNEFSFNRKIKELWISFQLEKKYTKNEILTLYLNHVPFGYGVNGVQAASKFFFDKDVGDLSYAEAASLITVISNPTFYSFIKFPQNHKTKQKQVLSKMVKAGIITKAQADKSLEEFWINWQTTSHSEQGAFLNRNDKAPFFSNWVLAIIEKEMPNVNVYKDGLVIHSTLDLKANLLAEQLMKGVLEKQQKIFEENQKVNFNVVQNRYIDTVALLSTVFNISNVNIGKDSILRRGMTKYQSEINPGFNLISKVLGIDLVDTATENSFLNTKNSESVNDEVQGAFLAIDNKTGQIVTMVGGGRYDPNNRFNYAMQGRRQPGSSFKPLVYSAALDTGIFTAASVLMDEETTFTFDSQDPDDWYIPNNYGEQFNGPVTFRRALRRSLNIPAIKIFYEIGKNNQYKVPLDRAALLMGLTAQKDIDARFKREISTVLGTGSASLSEMVGAFSVFANLGQKNIQNSILYVEDRDGKIVYEPWKKLEKYYSENQKRLQIISPQNAYIITDILKGAVHHPDGFLYGAKNRIISEGKAWPDVEMAAKTGTTQNWSDAWEIGFSPEITAGGWVGFKEYGLSLGYEQPAVVVLGPTWLEYMRQYHLGKGKKSFKDPGGFYRVKVCKQSGKLPSPDCSESDLFYEMFLPGTVPKDICNVCGKLNEQKNQVIGTSGQDGSLSEGSLGSVNVDKSLLGGDDSKNKDLFKDDDTYNFDEIDKILKKDSSSDKTQ